jgi:hypothetical protein
VIIETRSVSEDEVQRRLVLAHASGSDRQKLPNAFGKDCE